MVLVSDEMRRNVAGGWEAIDGWIAPREFGESLPDGLWRNAMISICILDERLCVIDFRLVGA